MLFIELHSTLTLFSRLRCKERIISLFTFILPSIALRERGLESECTHFISIVNGTGIHDNHAKLRSMIQLNSVLYCIFRFIVAERRKWFLWSCETARNRRVSRLSGPHHTSLIAIWHYSGFDRRPRMLLRNEP